ncbi:MAG TPA: hypothetical protein PLI09_28305 [Candidatus Hydrogenedentes bacterium]|nr:hypothetical protein [Candidatus Hydrogenedentota bacterium]
MGTNRGNDFWQDLDDSLNRDPVVLDDDMFWRFGFDLARRVQGVLLAHGYDPARVDLNRFEDFLKQIADDYEMNADELTEQVWDAWDKIRLPAGIDPIAAAAAAPVEVELKGKYPNAQFKTDAARVLNIAQQLSQTTSTFYLPVHKLAGQLNTQPKRIARILRALEKNGHLWKRGAYSRTKAQRWELTQSLRVLDCNGGNGVLKEIEVTHVFGATPRTYDSRDCPSDLALKIAVENALAGQNLPKAPFLMVGVMQEAH